MTEVLTYEALKAERDALAVENQALKESRQRLAEFIHEELDTDYPLNLEAETPATDAALAAIQAQGVEKIIKLKMEQLASMHPDTHAFGATAESLRAQINELQAFAANIREAK
ncbi:hypothetical protein [Serratia marcescens]|uniref:hypothetical protein n=1 Tax=Serratia marcescens TaxID=615 RepID=UPI0036F987F7